MSFYYFEDQYGMPLVKLTEAFNASEELPVIIDAAGVVVNGRITLDVLDNPLSGLTIDEVSDLLARAGVEIEGGGRGIRRLCLDGTLRAKRYPLRWRVMRGDVDRYLMARCGGDAM